MTLGETAARAARAGWRSCWCLRGRPVIWVCQPTGPARRYGGFFRGFGWRMWQPGGRCGRIAPPAGQARLGNAGPLPRFPVAAVSARRIYLFRGPVPNKDLFAVRPRTRRRWFTAETPCAGSLDILTTHNGVPRSCTMLVSGLDSVRKRLQELIGELQSQ